MLFPAPPAPVTPIRSACRPSFWHVVTKSNPSAPPSSTSDNARAQCSYLPIRQPRHQPRNLIRPVNLHHKRNHIPPPGILIAMKTSFTSNGNQVTLEGFIPPSSGPLPALLILHGSGGNTGFWLERIAPFTQRLNLALFAVHYLEATGDVRAQPAQLTDGVHVPLWIEAARLAIRLITENPAVDPKRIALIGVSLGAFMSVALGTDPTLPIRAIVDVSGGLITPWNARATTNFPPTLILHGDRDNVVAVSHAHDLDALLTRLKVPHEMKLLAGEGHFFSGPAQLQLLAAISPFLAQYL